LFNRTTGIGLDIGSKRIKLVQVKKAGERLRIVKYGSMPTPAGLVEAGNIFDPERLGEEMAPLVEQLDLRGKKVVSAVSGQQVYTRILILPRMSLKETKATAIYQAVTYLPISVEEAAMDVFLLRDFTDEEGKKQEVFFVATPQLQVNNLEICCRLAGLKLAAVEIEPLALNRLLHPAEESGIWACVHLGASRSYFSVFRDDLLLFYRTLTSFYENIKFIIGEDRTDSEQINIAEDSQFKFIVRDLAAEVGRSVEYFNIQNEQRIAGLYLSGGGASVQGLDQFLSTQISCPIYVADPISRFCVPSRADDAAKGGLNYDFTVALGLALRGIV